MEQVQNHEILEAEEEEEEEEEEEDGTVIEAEESKREKLNPADIASSEIFSDALSWPLLRFDIPPRRIYHFAHQFRSGSNPQNFFKGVKWSPDGSSFLTCSDDQSLRLFYLPQDAYCDAGKLEDFQISQDSYSSALIVNEAEMVYDYCWYPYMSLLDPATCVFASTTKDHPIHLWDAISGELRGTYRAYNAMDEITAALSVSFNSSGTKLFAGYDKHIRVFDIHRPGRDYEQYPLAKDGAGSTGIVSSIAFSPTYSGSGMIAVGSYSQTTSLYAETHMELLYVLHGQMGGVTQVQFSKDGNYIYTGGRKDPYILCWDIRNTVGVLYKLYRSSEFTNQRISFDIEPNGRHLGTGGQDGIVHIYDLQSGEWVSGFQAASDTVNCFSFHPSVPLAASSSGNRRFCMLEDEDKSNILSGDENCASIWDFSGSKGVETDFA